MKKSFHSKLWCFGSDTLVETLAFRAAAFDALVFVPGDPATDHGHTLNVSEAFEDANFRKAFARACESTLIEALGFPSGEYQEVSLNEFEPARICYLLEALEQLVEDLKLWTGSPGILLGLRLLQAYA
ncbi:unnamed protein product [Sphagnum tenellum]